MALDINVSIRIVLYLFTLKALLHQTIGQLIVYHSTPETWYDANEICSERLASLTAENAQIFAAVRVSNNISSTQMWSGLYWRNTGNRNILVDTDCQSPGVLGVDGSKLNNENPTNSAERCVLLNFTTSPSFSAENCDVKLPFACEADAILEAGIFTQFFFEDGFDDIKPLTARECRTRCLQNTALPCLSLIYLGSLSNCFMFPDRVGSVGKWNTDWYDTTQHYKLQLYADKFSLASGSIFVNLDIAASLVDGCSADECQLKCAWLNEKCVCADYQNGQCRLFDNSLLCSSLIPSIFSDSQTFIKTTGDLKALFIDSDPHTVSAASADPPQLSCPIPSSVLLSPTSSFFSRFDVGSSEASVSDLDVSSEIPPTTLAETGSITIDSTLTVVPSDSVPSGLVASTVEIAADVTVIPDIASQASTFLQEWSKDVSSVFSSFQTVIPLETLPTPDLSTLDLARSSNVELESSRAILISLSEDLSPSPSINLSHNTYFISKSGSLKSSKFECDVVSAVTVKLDITSTLANYECKMITIITRSLADNDTSFIDKVVENLSIDEKEISAYKRKYISAHDGRPSARNVGILGIAMLACVFGGLLLLDLSTIKRDIHLLLENLRS